MAAPAGYGGKAAHELTQPRTIDVAHFGKIEQNVLLPVVEVLLDGVPQRSHLFAYGDPAVQVQNHYVAAFTNMDFQTHEQIPFCRSYTRAADISKHTSIYDVRT